MPANRVIGLLLVAVGTALLLVMTTGLGGEAFLGMLGIGFLTVYARKRAYGFLIPGAILTGLAGGILADRLGAPDAAVVMGLGCGFIAIAAVDRLIGSVGPGWWWPLVPGGILIAVGGVAVTGVDRLPSSLFPTILIIVGMAMLLRRRDAPADRSTGAPAAEHRAPDAQERSIRQQSGSGQPEMWT
jgi:hypothetical protein